MAQDIEYCALIFSPGRPFPEEAGAYQLFPNCIVETNNLSPHVKLLDEQLWKQWIGETSWEELFMDASSILIAWKPKGSSPEFTPKQIVDSLWRVLPYVCVQRNDIYESAIIEGNGIEENGMPLPTGIESFTPIRARLEAYFIQQSFDKFCEWADNHLDRETFMARWKAFYSFFLPVFKDNERRQLTESFRSYEQHTFYDQLEFRIPNLTRSIEALVPRWGAVAFADTVAKITGTPGNTLPFDLHTNYNENLKLLYKLRNDCAHGKPFGYSFHKETGRDPTSDDIAFFEFLADWSARKIVEAIMKDHEVIAILNNYDALEKLWEKRSKATTP